MIEQFLTAVLGNSGAQALLKASKRTPALESVLVPRTLVSWLSLAVRPDYEGEVPGISNSYVRLNKSDDDTFTGAVTVGEAVHVFDQTTILHCAAALAVSMGLVSMPSEDLSGNELTRLGKSLDLLVKAKVLSESLGDDLQKAMSAPLAENAASHYSTGHMASAQPVATTALGNGMFHHVMQSSAMPEAMFHHISASKDPKAPSIAQIHGTKEEGNPFTIGFSQVNPNFKGKGYGRQLYQAALQHHGTIASDSNLSSGADKAWQHLSKQPGVSVKFGAPGTNEPHVATTAQVQKVELPGGAQKPVEPTGFNAPAPPVAKAPKIKQQQVAKREAELHEDDLKKTCPKCKEHPFRQSVYTGCACFSQLYKSICTKRTSEGLFLEFGNNLTDEEVDAVIDNLNISRGTDNG